MVPGVTQVPFIRFGISVRFCSPKDQAGADNGCFIFIFMSPAGLEPTTDALEKRCSVQLSYEDNTRSPVVLVTSRRSYVIQVVQSDDIGGVIRHIELRGNVDSPSPQSLEYPNAACLL